MIKTDTINWYNQVHINDKTIYCYSSVRIKTTRYKGRKVYTEVEMLYDIVLNKYANDIDIVMTNQQ